MSVDEAPTLNESEFPLSTSDPADKIRLTAAECNCQRGLHCQVLSRATEGAIRASRENPKGRNRPSFDLGFRHFAAHCLSRHSLELTTAFDSSWGLIWLSPEIHPCLVEVSPDVLSSQQPFQYPSRLTQCSSQLTTHVALVERRSVATIRRFCVR
jgi:hypothetical protein